MFLRAKVRKFKVGGTLQTKEADEGFSQVRILTFVELLYYCSLCRQRGRGSTGGRDVKILKCWNKPEAAKNSE